MPQFPETSQSLIARVQDPADETAWAEFLGIYEPVVHRMARRRGMQDADARDVAQQVFVSIARAIERWTPGDDRPPFRAWLTTIARNAITKALSRRPGDVATGTTSVAEALLSQPDPGATTDEIRAEARLEMVRWAIEQIRPTLTESTWNIFVRTMIAGEAIADVAESSGRSVGAIYVTRYRVRSRLRTLISELSEDWEPAEE